MTLGSLPGYDAPAIGQSARRYAPARIPCHVVSFDRVLEGSVSALHGGVR